MRHLVLAALLFCLGAVAPAQVETWNLRNSGDSSSKGVAAPLAYCLRGIAVGGGVCAGPNYQTNEQDRERRSNRRDQKERWNNWDRE